LASANITLQTYVIIQKLEKTKNMRIQTNTTESVANSTCVADPEPVSALAPAGSKFGYRSGFGSVFESGFGFESNPDRYPSQESLVGAQSSKKPQHCLKQMDGECTFFGSGPVFVQLGNPSLHDEAGDSCSLKNNRR
jgi:hypothetical protein